MKSGAAGYRCPRLPPFAELQHLSDRIYNGPRCETGVLFGTAKRRMTPALEVTAIDTLHNSMAYRQFDAVRTLGAYGSARALPALWDAFDQWHRRWRHSDRKWPELPDNYQTWDEALGDAFAVALVQSVAWHLDQDGARRGRALCLTSYCDYLTEKAVREVTQFDTGHLVRDGVEHHLVF